MLFTFEEAKYQAQKLLTDLAWINSWQAAIIVLLLALAGFIILTSMTMPAESRRPRSFRARLHIRLLASVSALGAWVTFMLAGISLLGAMRHLSGGLETAWREMSSHHQGLPELTFLCAAIVIALLARWHREHIAGTRHFTLAHAVRCQSIRSAFLAAPLLLLGLAFQS